MVQRRRVAKTRREDEERYRFLVESVNDWIWEVDQNGVYTYAGPQCREILGYDPEEIVGKTPFDLMPPEEARRIREIFVSIASQAKPFRRLENVNRRKDGRLVVLETNGVPILNARGKLAGYRGVDRDITERKHMEEALRQEEYLLSESQRIGHIGAWSVDQPGDLAVWTAEMYRLFGVSPKTFVASAENFIELLHPEDRDAMQEWIRAALAGEHPGVLEVRVVQPDGSLRVVSGQGELIPPHDNLPARLVGTAQDVTDQKRAQAALQESEERYRILLEHGFDGIFVHENFRIVQVNDRFAEMVGYTRAELLGTNGLALFTPDSQQRIRAYIRSGAGGCYEVKLRHREGRLVEVEAYGASCQFQGRSARIVGLRDITERKQAQETMQRLNQRLEAEVAQRTEELRRTVDRLQRLTLELSQTEDRERKRIADLLHDDVQQTLAAAKFHLNLLSKEPRSTEESQEIIEQVRQMLKEAIEKARSLSHELSPVLYQVDLTEILNWLARHMQHKHGLTVRVDALGQVDSPSEPLKALLFKAVQELLFNVVKHAGVSEAFVRVRRVGSYICLAVADRGRGFDPRELPRTPGFGLLGIQERIQLLGGRMKIRSAAGRGSRFLIVVPDRITRDRSDSLPASLQTAASSSRTR